MVGKAFFFRFKIVAVDLVADKIKSRVVGRDPAGAAAEVGIEYLVAGVGKMLKYPGIERNRLLRRMDASGLERRYGDALAGQVKVRPCQLKGRIADFRGILLVPAQPAMGIGGGEHTDKVVCAPNDLMAGDAAQLPKILRGRRLRVPQYPLVLAGLALAPSHVAVDAYAIRGIDDGKIKSVFGHFP